MSEQKELAVFTTVEKDNLNKFVTETQVALNGFDQTLYRLIIAVEALRAILFDKGIIWSGRSNNGSTTSGKYIVSINIYI